LIHFYKRSNHFFDMFPSENHCSSDMSLTCVTSVDEGNAIVSSQGEVSGPVCDKQDCSMHEELLLAQDNISHEPNSSLNGRVHDGVNILHSFEIRMSKTEHHSTAESSMFDTFAQDKSHEVVRSPEILRGEAGPAPAAPVLATCFAPRAEHGCQARRAPAVDSLEYLVDYRHDQQRQVPGQVRQVMSSTVMIGQGEEEIVKEDISVIHARASMDPRVSREPAPPIFEEVSDEHNGSSDAPGFLHEVTEDGEPDALRRFILNQLGTMSPPATSNRSSQSSNQCTWDTASSSVNTTTGSGKGCTTTASSKKYTMKPRVVPELNFFTDQEIYRGKPTSEKLFDEFLEDEANDNLRMRKMVPLRKKVKRTVNVGNM